MAKKPTNAEKQKRVDTIIDLITQGYSRAAILQYVADNTDWKVIERTVDSYLADAYQYFRQLSSFNKEQKIGEAVSRLEVIISKSMMGLDYQRSINAQRELNQLLGLYAPPAAQTLKIQGIDLDQMVTVAAALEARGMKASDVFNRMIQRLAINEGVTRDE